MTSASSKTFFLRYRPDTRALLILLVLLILVYLPLLYHQIAYSADYTIRIQQAYSLVNSGEFNSPTPNILYSGLVALTSRILPLDLSNAAVVVTLFTYLAGGIIVYALLRQSFPGRIPARLTFLLIFLTFTLLTIAPITPTVLVSTSAMLFAYVVISPHYNPTIPLLRPFALITLVTALPIFDRSQSRYNWRWVLLTAALVIVSVWAKPNWAIALIPALMLAAAWYLLRRRALDWRLLMIGYVVPVLLMLGYQYWLTYTGQDTESSQVVLAPFRAILVGDITLLSLIVTLLLSMLFPVYVGVRYLNEVKTDTGWWLSGLTFAMALIQGLLLDENGERQGHGNFLWGTSIALFAWFVISTQVFLRIHQAVFKREATPQSDFFVGAVIYLLHALVGIGWLIAHFSPLPIVLG